MRKTTNYQHIAYPTDIKNIILRLAHFDPTCKDNYGNKIIDYLVLDALLTYGQLVVTAYEIKKCIKRNFLLDFEEEEIIVSGRRLHKKKMIEFEEKNRTESPSFKITPETEENLAKNLAASQGIEKEVLDRWKEEIIKKYKEYSVIEENIDKIIDNLKIFMTKMFIRHGAECVALLYPDKSKKWLENIDRSILDNLPSIEQFIDGIIRYEVPKFFLSDDPKRIAYITSLFNSSFFWHLIQVDDKCSKLLRNITAGQKLYLDNNIIYSLVGLHGEMLCRSVNSMLKLAKELGYNLLVTTKTVEEFNNSLKWQLKELKRVPKLPRDLLRIAIKSLGEDDFVTNYWKEFLKNGISIEEFVSEKSHIEEIISVLEINITDEYRKEIEGSEELRDEESMLRTACGDSISERIIEHDAFHRVLITKIRKGAKYKFNDAVAWFLTHDSKLPVYDRAARKGEDFLPFCLTTEQWVQVNRPLLKRTSSQKEYEESFHILVSQPFLRTMLSSESIEKASLVVLQRLAKFKNMTPELALNITADKHFLLSMADEEDEVRILEKIDSKMVDIAEELRKKIERVEEEKRRDESKIKELTSRAKRNEEKIVELTKSLEQEQERSGKNEIEIKKLGSSLDQQKEKTEEAEVRYKKLKSKLKKWLIFIFSLTMGAIFLWNLEEWFNWMWYENHSKKVFITIIAQLLLIPTVLNITLKKYWKVWIGIIVSLTIALIVLSATQ